MFLQNDLQQLLENLPLDARQLMWYQHVGASAHYGREWLGITFLNKLIGRDLTDTMDSLIFILSKVRYLPVRSRSIISV